MVAMTVIVVVLIAAVNIVNWNMTERTLDGVISEIVQNRPYPPAGGMMLGPRRESAMTQYGNRYFIVSLDENLEMTDFTLQQEIISSEEAQKLAEKVAGTGQKTGYADEYKFLMFERRNGMTSICFLDCSTNLKALHSLLLISVLVGAAGIVLGFLFILFMSRKTVEPVRINIEKQKQFITNAGHELKTPLSAIATNMDILTMDLGENEWVDGTKKQVRRLRKLVENLVSLSKTEEEDLDIDLKYFDLSDVVNECIDGFDPIAQMSGKQLKAEIQDHLTVQGDPSMVQQLISILCDNAIKYSRAEEPIELKLYAEGKTVIFQTANAWDRNVDPDHLDMLFERFYRGDPARNPENKSSGHGLGLSIARAMAEKNHARLTADTDSGGRILFRAVFKKQRKEHN